MVTQGRPTEVQQRFNSPRASVNFHPCRPIGYTYAAKPYANWPGWCPNYVQNVRYSISIMGKMTGKSYAPTEMIIRGLPGFAGGWGPHPRQPHPREILAAGIRGGRIWYTPRRQAAVCSSAYRPLLADEQRQWATGWTSLHTLASSTFL